MMAQHRDAHRTLHTYSLLVIVAVLYYTSASERVVGDPKGQQNLGPSHGGNPVKSSYAGPDNPEHAGAAKDTGKVRKSKGKMIQIADTKECGDDVHRFCSDKAKAGQNNFLILDCLQNDEKTNNKVSDDCQHYLWQFKHNLTLNDGFDKASSRDCGADLAQFEDCRGLEIGKGLRIPCLIEHYDEVSSKSCKIFLNKMGSVIFSDFRFLHRFMTECEEDINSLKCGRMEVIGDENDDSPHSQGATVECLNKNRKMIARTKCKVALRRVDEMKADDFHHDRPLYYACKDDREQFCHDVVAGDGAVYDCLVKNIAKKTMSEQCREKLELREQEISEDIKIDKVFYEACKADITINKCTLQTNPDSAFEEDLSRSTVLLCLEKAQADGKKVQPGCLKQMFQMRSVMMQDYKVSPELVSSCKNEINKLCHGLEVGGATLQCLMKKIVEAKDQFGNECKAQVRKLLKIANPGEDIRLDRPLQKACGAVVSSACSSKSPGDGEIITCLLENLDHEDMTDDCEDLLINIQYFAVRDFKLDHRLFIECKKDAKILCHNSDYDNPRSTKPESGPLVFACLHRHLRSNETGITKLSKSCNKQVLRVMKERSFKVKLMPEVESACMAELSQICSDDDEHKAVGGEMACLQDNMDQLSDTCKKVIIPFTVEQGENIELDQILMKACTPMITKFCGDKIDNDALPTDVLDCLIEYKNSFEMNSKCAAGIEHHQLISLKDFRFNHKFRRNCQEAVSTLCKHKNTKYDVVACLSEHVRNDTLKDTGHRVDRACRKELRFELLQRGESINLDPELKKKCSEDVKKFCVNIDPGKGAVIECLKSHTKKLTHQCHKLIFKREQDENLNGDYVLHHTCKRMIKLHCRLDGDEAELLDCLKEHRDDNDFDESCRKVVLRRQVEQSHDYRLNPHLQKACFRDIPKFCSHLFDSKNTYDDEEMEGKVINCLKKQYTNKAKSLSKDCEHEVKSSIKEANLDINQNPVVMKICKKDIKHFCMEKISNVHKMEIDPDDEDIETFGEGTVIECLKQNFQKLKDITCKKEVAYLLAESRVDIHVDPLLHSSCHHDLLTLCQTVSQGQGRQMSCLLSYLDTDPDSLSQGCRGMLSRRKDLWEYAAQVAPPESFSEFYEQINSSPARNYFLAVMFTAIGIIFIVGITCGRVTKRVRAELKNK